MNKNHLIAYACLITLSACELKGLDTKSMSLSDTLAGVNHPLPAATPTLITPIPVLSPLPVTAATPAPIATATPVATSGDAFARVTLTFDSAASAASVTKAALRYNKDFAYSLTLDDGTLDHYTHAFFLLNGGHSAALNRDFAGLASTDGCGNKVTFRGASAWNSTNAYHYKLADGFDPHLDNNSGSVSWTQLGLMSSAGWDVLNHSFAHLDAGAGVAFDPSEHVSKNNDKVLAMIGYQMTDFVIPSGDVDYRLPAFNLGMKGVYNQAWGLPGTTDGLKIDAAISSYQFEMIRYYVNDYGTSTVNDHLDALANRSSTSAHYWWQSFTHDVSGSSLAFSTLETLMTHLENMFGRYGSDRVWVAGPQSVHEYLTTRDLSVMSTTVNGNQIEIKIDLAQIPATQRTYPLSLVINSGTNFTVSSTNTKVLRYTANGSGTKKLINLELQK